MSVCSCGISVCSSASSSITCCSFEFKRLSSSDLPPMVHRVYTTPPRRAPRYPSPPRTVPTPKTPLEPVRKLGVVIKGTKMHTIVELKKQFHVPINALNPKCDSSLHGVWECFQHPELKELRAQLHSELQANLKLNREILQLRAENNKLACLLHRVQLAIHELPHSLKDRLSRMS